jgi:cytochrome c oxidase subunit 4
MEEEKTHLLSFKAQIGILLALIVLMFLAIGVTRIDLGPLSLVAILVIAAIQVFIVMTYHMHLKFEKPFFKVMVICLFALFIAVLIVTISDYLFR